MSVQASVKGEQALLLLDRQIRGAEAVELFERVRNLVAGGVLHICLDMGPVERIDSAGLGMLVSAAQRSQEAGVHFELCHLRPETRSTLETAGLLRILTVVPDPPAGLTACNAPKP